MRTGSSGGEGDDTLAGGIGDAPDGPDFLSGAEGSDTATYATRSTGVSVTIGGGPNAEGDIVGSSVENLTGGSGDDALTGGGVADEDADEDQVENVLDGRGGDDTLAGGDAPGAEWPDSFIGGETAPSAIPSPTRAVRMTSSPGSAAEPTTVMATTFSPTSRT